MGRPKGSKNKPKSIQPQVTPKMARKARGKREVGVQSEVKYFRVIYNIGESTYPYEVTVKGVGTEVEAIAGTKQFSPSANVVEVIEVNG